MFGKIDPGNALIMFFGFLVAVTMHGAAQAIAARALGDRSSETESRATVNPLPHIDIFGTIIFPLLMLFSGIPFLFGWAKPLQTDSRYFKKLRRDITLSTLAGPAFNFVIALAGGLALRFMGADPGDIFQGDDPTTRLLGSVATSNVVIGLFNLLPFPNSDGWKILLNHINYNIGRKLQELATPIHILFMLLLIFGGFSRVFGTVLAVFYGVLLN